MTRNAVAPIAARSEMKPPSLSHAPSPTSRARAVVGVCAFAVRASLSRVILLVNIRVVSFASKRQGQTPIQNAPEIGDTCAGLSSIYVHQINQFRESVAAREQHVPPQWDRAA